MLKLVIIEFVKAFLVSVQTDPTHLLNKERIIRILIFRRFCLFNAWSSLAGGGNSEMMLTIKRQDTFVSRLSLNPIRPGSGQILPVRL